VHFLRIVHVGTGEEMTSFGVSCRLCGYNREGEREREREREAQREKKGCTSAINSVDVSPTAGFSHRSTHSICFPPAFSPSTRTDVRKNRRLWPRFCSPSDETAAARLINLGTAVHGFLERRRRNAVGPWESRSLLFVPLGARRGVSYSVTDKHPPVIALVSDQR